MSQSYIQKCTRVENDEKFCSCSNTYSTAVFEMFFILQILKFCQSFFLNNVYISICRFGSNVKWLTKERL